MTENKRIIMKLDEDGYGEINLSEPVLNLIEKEMLDLIAVYDW